MQYEVRHSVAGRLRLRTPALRWDQPAVDGFLDHIRSIEAVADARWNGACASVIVSYDAKSGAAAELILCAVRTGTIRGWKLRAVSRRQSNGNELGVSPELAKRFEVEEKSLGTAVVAMALVLFGGPVGSAVAVPLLLWNALPTCYSAARVLIRERRLNVDFLDGLAILIGLAQANLVTTAMMILLIRLGNWIRERTAGRSRRAIDDLLDYQNREAWVLRGTAVLRVPVKSLTTGDEVVVYAGEIVPVDGEVLRGTAIVDQKTITGESLPVRRTVGEMVHAATVLREGKLLVRAQKVGQDTAAAQIVQLVNAAPIGETRIQNYAEKFADRLVAPQLAFGCGLFFLTGNVNRLLSMTIIDYGTGMRVAAPTAVLASITHAARQGIVIRSGSHVEKLAGADTVVFDKTGTLTTGCPEIASVLAYRTPHFSERKVLGLAAAVEARLRHPVAHAVLSKAREMGVAIPERANSHYEIGLGVSAQVNGYMVHVGSERFLKQNGIGYAGAQRDLADVSRKGFSPLLVAVDGELIGVIPYADRVRPESADVIHTLHERDRIKQTVMLTGDNSVVARAVAERLGIRKFVSDMMPADKAEVVCQLQKEGHVVAMVGDGINDSPALAYADIGIAMKNGADVAQESADIVLMEDNLWKLVKAVEICKESMQLIRQNYAMIAGLNTLALVLSLPAGLMSPNVTALISNGSAILAAVNAIRPILRY